MDKGTRVRLLAPQRTIAYTIKKGSEGVITDSTVIGDTRYWTVAFKMSDGEVVSVLVPEDELEPAYEGRSREDREDELEPAYGGRSREDREDELGPAYGVRSMEDREDELLLNMARPDIYRINAFRCLGLTTTASKKDAHSQLRKLELAEKFGNSAQIDGGILPLIPPPDADARQAAAQRLNNPEQCLIDELFWFWPLSLGVSADMDDALVAMRSGDFSGAVSLWKRHEEGSSEANVSMHNLAIMYHALALDLEYAQGTQTLSKKQIQQKQDYWEQAFPRWQVLLNHDGFWHRLTARIRELGDPRLTTGTARRIREGLPLVLLSINATLAIRASEKNKKDEVSYHVGLMRDSGFGDAVIGEALRRAVAPLRDRVKLICTDAKSEAERSPEHGDKVALGVVNQTSQLLSMLDMVLPKEHPSREAAHDEVASCIVSSQIASANKTENWSASLKLLQQAVKIAVGASVRQRIEENIEIVKKNMEYATCWFCGKRPSEDRAVVEVKMYGNVMNTPTWSGVEVRWQQGTIIVPRCAGCKSAHDHKNSFETWGKVVGVLLGLLGIGGCMAVSDDWSLFFGIFFIGLGVGAYYLIKAAGEGLPEGIKPLGSANEFPAVKKRVSEGWGIGAKPPGVQ